MLLHSVPSLSCSSYSSLSSISGLLSFLLNSSLTSYGSYMMLFSSKLCQEVFLVLLNYQSPWTVQKLGYFPSSTISSKIDRLSSGRATPPYIEAGS